MLGGIVRTRAMAPAPPSGLARVWIGAETDVSERGAGLVMGLQHWTVRKRALWLIGAGRFGRLTRSPTRNRW